MNNLKKIITRIFIIILIFIFIISFSHSYTALNIDNLAFVVALGIDSSDSKEIKVTFQFVTPPSSNEGSSQETQIFEDTVDTNSIPNAINIMNSYLARKIDLSHCRNIVFSEEIAKNGISNFIYTLMNDDQVRPTSNIIVSTCSANEYIKNSIPSLETSITRYYDIFPSSGKYTGYVSDATIGNFYNALVCNACEPYTILGGVTSSTQTDSQSTVPDDSNIKSGASPISGLRSTENIGVGVFKHDKLVGELDAIETVCFHILKNNLSSFLVSIPDYNNSNSKIDLILSPKNTVDFDIKIINGSPFIKINCEFTAKVFSIDENTNYLNKENLNSVSYSCNSYMENVLLKYLYKTSVEFRSDINGIGKYALSKFQTNTDFKNFNWIDNYMNSTFKVDVNTTVDSGFLLNKT